MIKFVAQNIKKFLELFTGTYNWELEKYLSQSTDAADLEYRMQKWERQRSRHNLNMW